MVVQTDSGMGMGMLMGIVLAILVVLLIDLLVFGGFGNSRLGRTTAPDVENGTGNSAPTNPSPTNMRIRHVTPTDA